MNRTLPPCGSVGLTCLLGMAVALAALPLAIWVGLEVAWRKPAASRGEA